MPKERERPFKMERGSILEEMMALDGDLVRLLSRRAELLRKLRKGKAHVSTPAASRSEKALRANWESLAARLSRSPRFVRGFFNLLQDMDMQIQDAPPAAPFNLAPARSPMEVDMPGPCLTAGAQLWLALGAGLGWEMCLLGPSPVSPLQDTLRVLAQCGAGFAWSAGDGPPGLRLAGGGVLAYYDKALLVGEDLLSFYLPAFLGMAGQGRMRFVGGANLKQADLSALSALAPALGARLAYLVPGARGLPVALECSGRMTDFLTAPPDLPWEGLAALLLAPIVWSLRQGRSFRLSLEHTAPESRREALDAMLPLFRALPPALRPQFARDGAADNLTLEYRTPIGPAPEAPAEIKIGLDASLCSFWLALPLFTGGRVRLIGSWPDVEIAEKAVALLKDFALELSVEEAGPRSAQRPGGGARLWGGESLPAALHPLFWVLMARLAYREPDRAGPFAAPPGADLDLAEDFLAQAGFSLLQEEGGLLRLQALEAEEFKGVAAKTHGWICPDHTWGMAFSLAAFIRANLKLGNPGLVQARWPNYWQLYNRLPSPVRAQEKGPGAERGRQPAAGVGRGLEMPEPVDGAAGAPGAPGATEEKRPRSPVPGRRRVLSGAELSFSPPPPPQSVRGNKDLLPDSLPELRMLLAALEEEQQTWQNYIQELSALENPERGLFYAAELHEARRSKAVLAYRQDACRVKINRLAYPEG